MELNEGGEVEPPRVKIDLQSQVSDCQVKIANLEKLILESLNELPPTNLYVRQRITIKMYLRVL